MLNILHLFNTEKLLHNIGPLRRFIELFLIFPQEWDITRQINYRANL